MAFTVQMQWSSTAVIILVIVWFGTIIDCSHVGLLVSKRLANTNWKITVVEEPELPNCTTAMCVGPLAPIYCSGKLLHTSWLFGLYDRCPGDMMRKPPEQVYDAFQKLKYPLKEDVFKEFCYKNFAQTPYLQTANLTDWVEEPKNIRLIQDDSLRKFVKRLNSIWKLLGRKFIPEVSLYPNRFPVLAVPNPFVVPGGLFQMYFYWDSYWIMKGLLFSDMTKTVRNMIENFAYIIQFHGFIPNAGTIQLTRRSQPPLFTQMVDDYYTVTQNKTFLLQMLPYIQCELQWWRENRTTTVTAKNGINYTVFHYKSLTDCPRPENYLVDLDNGYRGSDLPTNIWSSIASACESGLDFSTRWFAYSGQNAGTKFSIRTNKIVPVDLNVFMIMNYISLAKLLNTTGKYKKAEQYAQYARDLYKALNNVMWNNTDGCWYDYDLEYGTHRNKFYPSNIFPLLLGDYNKKFAKQVLEYLKATDILKYPGGIPSSLENSKEQWDFPNGWAPSIHLFVKSLLKSGDIELYGIGKKIANKFIRTVYNGLMNPKPGLPSTCWEKYDVRYDDGRPGIGGEYIVQQGFGWTNGAVLDMIHDFYINTTKNKVLNATTHFHMSHVYTYLLILLALLCILLTAAWFICRIEVRKVHNRMQLFDLWGKPEESHLINDTDSD